MGSMPISIPIPSMSRCISRTRKNWRLLQPRAIPAFPTSGATAANTPFPKWRCIAEALVDGDADDRCNGINVYSTEIQNDYGFSGQTTWSTSTGIGHNQFTAGASLDRGSVDYIQNTQYGYLNPNYTITGVPAWQDGSASDNPVDSRVNLHGLTPNWSLYFTDTLTLAKTVNVTVSGRFNRLTVNNTDRINPIAGPGSLDGDYVFQRFNPAIGITWSPVSTVNAYASYTQSSRAPTAIELGCADPANPCSSAQCAGQRPAAAAGGLGNLGGRPARQAGDFVHTQSELECGRVPGRKSQRHPFRLIRAVRHRLLPELRQDAPRGVRCQPGRAHRARHLGPRLHLSCGHLSEPRGGRWFGEQHQRQRVVGILRDSTATSTSSPAIGFR